MSFDMKKSGLGIKLFALLSGIFMASAGAQGTAASITFDDDVPSELVSQMKRDFEFMRSIRGMGESELHRKIFGKINGEAYMNWLESRVESVGVSQCGSTTAVACVIPVFQNKIWITKNYTEFDHPQIARLSVIYHEARHTEEQSDNWAHARCPVPFQDSEGKDVRSIWTGAFLQGHYACDYTMYGSYGSQTILMTNLARSCSSCSEKVKADAELYGDSMAIRILGERANQQMRRDFKRLPAVGLVYR